MPQKKTKNIFVSPEEHLSKPFLRG